MSRLVDTNLNNPRIMTDIERAYLAGAMDGEGSIGLWKENRKENRCGFTFKPAFVIGNTNLEWLRWIRQTMGCGRISINNWNRKSDQQKVCYRMEITNEQIRIILPQIVNYLFIKRKQAEILLKYLPMVRRGANHRTRHYVDWKEKVVIYDELRTLNKRGI